ncbi:hypothetical protein TIFTF001_044354 [Ficus carica]|uniref:Uncharacterized protein n=1 Tax=Ficus carica TaxID=3494 RepID=A0AA87Z3W3_FICCA|nr:hypothetical protein TIFTF001_044348 [Ficus carica]GMN29468.1 hypothetical protein TIFTF001_044351 [Ficus carica]GMN29490.1 hypothetical protein TIFTF001_044353 [Ficus carica]GMN29504.1 hypothetical protein TIFTF001_044354 [Ficus carica]
MMFVISFTCLDRLLGNSSAQFLMNRLSGRVLGPTCKIFSNRAALSLRRLVGVTDSLVDDNVLRLISELEPPTRHVVDPTRGKLTRVGPDSWRKAAGTLPRTHGRPNSRPLVCLCRAGNGSAPSLIAYIDTHDGTVHPRVCFAWSDAVLSAKATCQPRRATWRFRHVADPTHGRPDSWRKATGTLPRTHGRPNSRPLVCLCRAGNESAPSLIAYIGTRSILGLDPPKDAGGLMLMTRSLPTTEYLSCQIPTTELCTRVSVLPGQTLSSRPKPLTCSARRVLGTSFNRASDDVSSAEAKPCSVGSPGSGIGHGNTPPTADAAHLFLSYVKSPPAANNSDMHCCPFAGDVHSTLPPIVLGLGTRGADLLDQWLLQAYEPTGHPR